MKLLVTYDSDQGPAYTLEQFVYEYLEVLKNDSEKVEFLMDSFVSLLYELKDVGAIRPKSLEGILHISGKNIKSVNIVKENGEH